MPNSATLESPVVNEKCSDSILPGASFGEHPIEPRKPDEGMGLAVARRTVFRKEDNEDWGKVADRVAYGNMSLAYSAGYGDKIEEQRLRNAIASGALLTSGRHLQHGDADQAFRPMEVYSNCSTSITSFAKFYLLLNGCFRAGTLIGMADGTFKKIEEVVEGDIVLSFDEDTKKFIKKQVIETHCNSPKPMVKVVMQNGEEIVCTEDHRFLTESDGWVEAKNLAGKNVVKAHGHVGKAKSPEFCQAASNRLKGIPKTEAHKEALRGPKTEAHKLALSLANLTPETQDRRRNTNIERYGVSHTSQIPEKNFFRPEYWIAKGMNREEAVAYISNFQKKFGSNHIYVVSHWTVDYWLDRGYSKEEAIEKIRILQTANSVKSGATVSREGSEFIDMLEGVSGAFLLREQVIAEKITVDALHEDTKTVIEYYGSFWHMHPSLFGPHDICRFTKRKAEEKWAYDLARKIELEELGFKVIVVWDHEATIETAIRIAQELNQ